MTSNVSFASSSKAGGSSCFYPISRHSVLQNSICSIEQLIKDRKAQIRYDHPLLEIVECPISLSSPINPVVANCGHLFERIDIEAWMQKERRCAVCSKLINSLQPVLAVKNLIDVITQKDPIPTCNDFEESDPALIEAYLQRIEKLIFKNEIKKALDLYNELLRYTKSSEIYARVPILLNQLGDSLKAELSNLYLSKYQLEEGKIEKAIETLNRCKKIENIVIPLLELIQPTSMPLKLWGEPSFLEFPLFPLELSEFLEEKCTIWPEKKRKKTHYVVPLFPSFDSNGEIVPRTIDAITKLCGYRGFSKGFSHLNLPLKETGEKRFSYGVMTINNIPSSSDGYIKQLLEEFPNDYEIPNILDFLTMILFIGQYKNNFKYPSKPSTFTLCKGLEKDPSFFLISLKQGSTIEIKNFPDASYPPIGIAALRKFYLN